MRLSCRAAENLLLSDEVLTRLNTDWNTLQEKISIWLEKNTEHSHFKVMENFKNTGFDRKNFNLKKIRNDLMGIIESSKPWEVVVGQTIAQTTYIETPAENSIQDYLGKKLVHNVLKPSINV